MPRDLYAYVEEHRNGRWEFVGEIEDNCDYDPRSGGDTLRFVPVSLLRGSSLAQRAALGGGDARLLTSTRPAVPLAGPPDDLSTLLYAWWARFNLPNAALHAVPVRALATCVWERMCTIVTWWDDTPLLPGMTVVGEIGPTHGLRDRIGHPMSLPTTLYIVRWRLTYAQAVGPAFLREVVERLVTTYGASEAARLVYWFY